MTSIQAEEVIQEYEIYPKPHKISYTGSEFVIRNEVNIVYDSTIDQPTKDLLHKVLEAKGKTSTTSDAIVEGKTNVLIGTYNSGEYVDVYAKDHYEMDASIFDNIDANYVMSDAGVITILGKQTDAAFFGITTLKHILSQIEGSTIRSFIIEDYADTKTRGFIEGYYGIPWSNEDRKSLMKFGGDFKMTSYIFAPKDDPYHSAKWRELYPDEKLAEIGDMARVGNETKCKFVWTIHPFMNGGITEATYDVDILKIKAKFDQLYDAGVRQFGVLGDDAGELPRTVVIRVMNDLQEWVDAKEDVYNLVFCPGGYNNSWWVNGELSDYDKGFNKDIQIFWTGNSVCAPIVQSTLDDFKNRGLAQGEASRRSPLFWLNWPVNDINMSRLMMGKGSLLHTDINVNDLSGAVTNPMQDAEPSKVALFAVADYAWNVKGFNEDKSWEDSFAYIDEFAGESLHILAKHMSDPAPNGHGLVLEESEELSPLLDRFMDTYAKGGDISADGTALVNEMNTIINACDDFQATSVNERMKEQILPFSTSLKELASAIKGYTEATMALQNDQKALAWEAYSTASASHEASKNHSRKTLDGTAKALPGSKRLAPFAEQLSKKIEPIVSEYLNVSAEKKLVITPSSSYTSIYAGKLENMMDGDKNSSVWFSSYEAVGQHVTISFNKPIEVTGINISMGTTGNSDTFGTGNIQYTQDGKNWIDVNDQTYADYQKEISVSGLKLQNILGLRYICTAVGSANKWVAIREFSFTSTEDTTTPLTPSIIKTTDWNYYQSNDKVASLLDDDSSTFVWCDPRNGDDNDSVFVGDYFGLDLGREVTLGNITIELGKNEGGDDRLKNFDLQYSSDGIKYTTYASYDEPITIKKDISQEGIQARYVRLVAKKKYTSWIAFRTFKVEQSKFLNEAYTNVDALSAFGASYEDDLASLSQATDITLKNGEYLGLKLDRIHELAAINTKVSNKNLKIQMSENEKEWKIAENPTAGQVVSARYIRILNDTDADITFDIEQFIVHTKEFYPPDVIKQNLGSIADGNVQNLFDGDRSTGLKYQATQKVGQNIIIDIGQKITLKDLKLVVSDSDKDYIRDGKVYVSVDAEGAWHEVMRIGDQVENTKADDTTINESFPIHDVSYNLVKASDLDMQARYIKIEITKPYEARWTKINEVEINNGEYRPSMNDARFVATVQEVKNGQPANMLDGNLTTMYIPSEKNGSIIYKISENTDFNNLKIIQSSGTISNAEVSIRTTSNKAKAPTQWVKVGLLNQSINEFTLPEKTEHYEVKIAWDNIIPNIIELSTSKVEVAPINKEKLQALLEEELNTSVWTTGSVKAYENAINLGTEIHQNTFASQNSVDTAVSNIKRAKDTAKNKGDTTQLKKEVAEALHDGSIYSAKTWQAYVKALQAAKTALTKEDTLSQEDISTLSANLKAAFEGLLFNPTSKEIAMVGAEDADRFVANVKEPALTYSKKSWETYLNGIATVKQLLLDHQTTPVSPIRFKEATDVLDAAKLGLVNIRALVTEIETFDVLENPAYYTEETFKNYQAIVESARAFLVDGTTPQVDQAVLDIQSEKGKLRFISGEDMQAYLDTLKDTSSENYTKVSYDALMNEIRTVENQLDESTTPAKLLEFKNGVLKKFNELVDVCALRAKIEEAEGLDVTKYTKSSIAKLNSSLIAAKQQLIDGTIGSISNAIKAVQNTMNTLVVRVTAEEIKNYLDSITEINVDAYTEESLHVYQTALTTLKNMLSNPEDCSVLDFIHAKEKFEEAEANLKQKIKDEIDNEQTEGADTGDDTFVSLWITVALLTGGFFCLILKKKQKNTTKE